MSRTHHVESKARRGVEYWSRRGFPVVRMATPGKNAKIATHRVERRQGKAEVIAALAEYDGDVMLDADELERYFRYTEEQ